MSFLTKDKTKLSNAIEISTDWAKRCKVEFGNNSEKALFELYKEVCIRI